MSCSVPPNSAEETPSFSSSMTLPSYLTLVVAFCLGVVFPTRSDYIGVFAQEAQQNIPTNGRGELPVGDDGKPLNLDFETGTLKDWTATGDAFDKQPVKGEIDQKRPYGAGQKSMKTGEHWLGGFEILRDTPKGTLTSASFKITKPFASFLFNGGSHDETRVELVLADSKEVILKLSGMNEELLRPVVVDLKQHVGKKMFIRIVDDHSGGWGHLNFDDFRLHDARPTFSRPELVMKQGPPIEQLYPNAGLSPEAAAKAMEVPEGFSVQLAVGEPKVQQPIAMAIDDRGRLWVAEAHEYPRRAPEGEGRDRILIFEDTDSDGTLDKRKVFAQDLNLVSGLEVGFGGVWVGAAPYLLFIPDEDGDDFPDSAPQVLLDGWGYHDTHETLNAFIWGPDGWLYGCHGVFTHSNVGRPGCRDSERTPLNAGIWRYHPTRHEFELFAEGTSNPWGVDFNDHGQAFCTACVIPHLFHIIQGARYERQGGQHFNPHIYDDIKTIADHRHYTGNQWNNNDRRSSDELGGGHAHAGAMIYLGGSWPAKYRDQIFMHNIHGNRVNLDLLVAHGSGYVGSHGNDFLLTRDQWSQMLNLKYGPDGQVWMIDWYDKNQCHRPEIDVHDRSNGRIFRVVYEGTKPVQVDLTRATDEQLVRYQTHENEWYVRQARRVLQERAANGKLNAKTKDALLAIARESANDAHRLRGLWAYHVTGGDVSAQAAALLKDRSPYVRGWTLQLLAERKQPLPPAIADQIATLARSDSSLVVRLYIASLLQRIPNEQRWTIFEPLLSHAEDVSDHNLPLMYWYAFEPLCGVDGKRALAMALSVGDRLPILREYAIRRIGANADEALSLLIDGMKQAPSSDLKLAFLRGINETLRGRRQVKPPEGAAGTLRELSKDKDQEIQVRSLSLALTFGDEPSANILRQFVTTEDRDVGLRRIALAALLKHRDAKLPDVLHGLVLHPELSSDAIRALAAYEDPQTPKILLGEFRKMNAAQQRDALSTLSSRVTYAKALLAAVEAKHLPSQQLSADLVRQLRNLKDTELNARIESVWGVVRDTPADKAALITRTRRTIGNPNPPPDVQLGRALFAKTCQQCHTLFSTGGRVGPDLTGSNRMNLDYLLSNVVDPSAVMAKEYQPSIIATNDGRTVTGIVRASDASSLTVQTANEVLVIPKDDIDEMKISEKSMMPDNLLQALDDHQIRSLVAYVQGTGQTPMLATADNVLNFFNGKDLTGWRGNADLWKVEGGEIIGRSPGLKDNEFLVSEMSADNFTLTFEVKLVPNAGNSGVQFRSEPHGEGGMRGYQADIGAGWWGKLYEEHGRELLWKESGEKHVKKDDWNVYKIEAKGSKIRTWINGQPCVDLDDPSGAKRGLIGLQIHSGGPMEVRFRKLQLSLE